MKRILSILTIAVFALSFGACDLLDSTPDRDTDSEIVIPDDSPSDDNSGNDNDGGNTDGDNGDNDGGNNGGDNTGDDPEDNTGDNTEGETDRSKYQQHNHTFTKGDAVYFGVYYEEQPADVANWWIELADDNFSLDDYSGEGYNIILEFFCKGTTPAAGTYTIEAFDKDPFSHMSLIYGYIDEYEGEDYPMGTWLYQGPYAIAGATDGSMTIAVSGSKYTVSYTLYDDDYQIAFQGSYTGELPVYDGTQTGSIAAPQNVAKKARSLAPVKPVRLLRVKK